MKNLLRCALLVLLSITLPAYGLASVVAPPCPMQASHGTASKMSATVAPKANCCADHAGNKSCKYGQQCSGNSSLFAPSAFPVITLPTPDAIATWIDSQPPFRTPVALWRPPRLL